MPAANFHSSARLTAGLLARKGAAHPAMRPDENGDEAIASTPDRGEAEQASRTPSLNTARRIRHETRQRAGKAAFTLRLDAERHLRLRLAVAAYGGSAQQLVTEALDRLFEDMPEIDALARQLDAVSGEEMQKGMS